VNTPIYTTVTLAFTGTASVNGTIFARRAL